MGIIRKATLAGAVLAAGAAGLTVLAGAAPAGADAPPHGTPAVTGVRTAAAPPVLLTCAQRPRFAPRRVVLACGNSSDYLRHLNWAVWSTTAMATGTERIGDCVPDCARGTFRHYRDWSPSGGLGRCRAPGTPASPGSPSSTPTRGRRPPASRSRSAPGRCEPWSRTGRHPPR